MAGANTFGARLRLTSFGESHGAALGAVIDGVPAGLSWDESLLMRELARRRPGSSNLVSSRDESDQPEVLSGVYDGKALGTPITVIVRSQDARSADYKNLGLRSGHADDVWQIKFAHSDPRGGGRSSGRETLARVIGGAVARMILSQSAPDFKIVGYARQIGEFELNDAEVDLLSRFEVNPEEFSSRFPSRERHHFLEKLLLDAKAEGRSYGGTVELLIDHVPIGLGQPVFHKLKADLAAAMMSVGATTSFEIGAGLAATLAEGSEFHRSLNSQRYGGIRGGISTGERIVLRVGFKPTSSVLDVAKKGRHDPCIVPRAIPVLEAMACLVLADHLLWIRTDQL